MANTVFVDSWKEGSVPDSFSVTGSSVVSSSTPVEDSLETTTAGESSSDGAS